jgi:hypothetical protein
MSTTLELQEFQKASEPSKVKPLDEAVWLAWVAKGRAQESRSRARTAQAGKFLLAFLLLAAVAWFYSVR